MKNIFIVFISITILLMFGCNLVEKHPEGTYECSTCFFKRIILKEDKNIILNTSNNEFRSSYYYEHDSIFVKAVIDSRMQQILSYLDYSIKKPKNDFVRAEFLSVLHKLNPRGDYVDLMKMMEAGDKTPGFVEGVLNQNRQMYGRGEGEQIGLKACGLVESFSDAEYLINNYDKYRSNEIKNGLSFKIIDNNTIEGIGGLESGTYRKNNIQILGTKTENNNTYNLNIDNLQKIKSVEALYKEYGRKNIEIFEIGNNCNSDDFRRGTEYHLFPKTNNEVAINFGQNYIRLETKNSNWKVKNNLYVDENIDEVITENENNFYLLGFERDMDYRGGVYDWNKGKIDSSLMVFFRISSDKNDSFGIDTFYSSNGYELHPKTIPSEDTFFTANSIIKKLLLKINEIVVPINTTKNNKQL